MPGLPGGNVFSITAAGAGAAAVAAGLDRAEATELLGSLRTSRDRAIAGLMLYSGLRSAEVLGLAVRDVDIRRSWVRVVGKGDMERRIPLDAEVYSNASCANSTPAPTSAAAAGASPDCSITHHAHRTAATPPGLEGDQTGHPPAQHPPIPPAKVQRLTRLPTHH